MGKEIIKRYIIFFFTLVMLVGCTEFTRLFYRYSNPWFINKISSQNSRNDLVDLVLTALGHRRLAADLAWIQVLQYYGTPEEQEKHHTESITETEPHHHQEGEFYGSGVYPDLFNLTLRTVRLDPNFVYPYLYTAGALAWNLNRTQEALLLLQEGIKNNPKYWRFRLYIGGIIYKQRGEFDKMTVVLEEVISYPDCPTMVKSILANIYEVQGRLPEAVNLWVQILNGTDYTYYEYAKRKIAILSEKNL